MALTKVELAVSTSPPNPSPVSSEESASLMSVICRRVLWILVLVVWTGLLWMPMSKDFQVEKPWPEVWTTKILFSKTLHVSVYATLTCLAGLLRFPLRYRHLLLFVLMMHASLTEYFQLYVFERTGLVYDVVFNHCGIGLGLLIGWRWWTQDKQSQK